MKSMNFLLTLFSVLLGLAMAGCGGGETTETILQLPQEGRFELNTTAQALFTEAAVYEGRAVGASTPPGRFRLEVRPSAEPARLATSQSVFKPSSVTWTTSLFEEGKPAAFSTFDASYRLDHLASQTGSEYDPRTGLIGISGGVFGGMPLTVGAFQYPREVRAGGSFGDHEIWLGLDLKLYDPANQMALGFLAEYIVRVSPVTGTNPPDKAWLCLTKNLYAPRMPRGQPQDSYVYCWLIGNDGRPLGPFKATLRGQGVELNFEGTRL